MMAAQHALVTRGLELATLRAVGGSGMGSFVSLEWGIHHPEMVRSLILLVPSPKAGPNFQLADRSDDRRHRTRSRMGRRPLRPQPGRGAAARGHGLLSLGGVGPLISIGCRRRGWRESSRRAHAPMEAGTRTRSSYVTPRAARTTLPRRSPAT